MSRIPMAIRVFVARRAKERCEFCQSSQVCTGQDFVLDHAIPESRGGPDSPENLSWCCVGCNSFKQARLVATDPDSGDTVAIFNPRRDEWSDHFCWSSDGMKIVGQTAVGRATVAALRLNRSFLVRGRQFWSKHGNRPPY